MGVKPFVPPGPGHPDEPRVAERVDVARVPECADVARPTRREVIVRSASAGGVLAAAAAASRWVWDRGGFDVVQSSAARQVRDYRIAERDAKNAELAVARAPAREAGDDSP